MGTKTVDQLTVITTLNSTDKIGVWKDSSDEYCGIAFSDFGTNLNLTAYLKADGSVTMTGALNLGTHAISGLTSITMTGTITGVTGITMAGTLNMNTNAISNITTLNGISLSTGFILAAGTVALTGDWDIGASRVIKAEQVRARSSAGLKLYEDGGTLGLFIADTGNVGILNTDAPFTLTVNGGIASRYNSATRYRGSLYANNAYAGFQAYDDTGAVYMQFYFDASIFTVRTGTAADKITTIDASGRLGLGIVPTSPLHVYHASASTITIDTVFATGVPRIDFTGADIWRPANTNNLHLGAFGGSSKWTIVTSTGYTAIGTTTAPDCLLHVHNGSAGSVSATANANLLIESNATSYLNFLTPNTLISGIIFGDVDDDNVGQLIYDHSNNNMTFVTNAGTRMTLTSTGTLGLGIVAPDSTLHVHGSTAGSVTAAGDTHLTIESNANTNISLLCPAANSSYIFFGSPTSNTRGAVQYNHSTDFLALYTTNNARVIIDNAGHTYPNVDNTQTLGSSGHRWSQLWAGTTTINTSDERAKTLIKPSVLGLNFIRALTPISWVWPNDERPAQYEGDKVVAEAVSIQHERPHYGFTSQQVKQAMDKLGIDFGGYVYDPDTDVYGLRYDEFIAPLVKAVQEQQDLIDKLTDSVRQLISQVKALQGA